MYPAIKPTFGQAYNQEIMALMYVILYYLI